MVSFDKDNGLLKRFTINICRMKLGLQSKVQSNINIKFDVIQDVTKGDDFL